MNVVKLFSKKLVLSAPVSGEMKPITQVRDELFSTKALGDGFVIEPTDDTVYAPIDGIVTSVFPTKHAIGFKNKQVEVLLHLGIDTVSLAGEGFQIDVSVGDKVTITTELGHVDFNLIKNKGLVEDVVVVITNPGTKKLTLKELGPVEKSQEVAYLE